MDTYELTDTEKQEIIDKALADASAKKKARYEQEVKAQREKEYAQMMLNPWSAEQYRTYIDNRSIYIKKAPYIVDNNNKEAVADLCLYFANDPHFETNGRSLKKGILLSGNIGCGKTYLLKLFSINQRKNFVINPVHTLCDLAEEIGSPIYYEYSNPQFNMPIKTETFRQNEWGRLFDDLGSENKDKNKYEERARAMREIISIIYEKNIPYHWFHVTTNLTLAQIKLVYGERVSSRMKDMFNFIELKGGDRRGNYV